MLDQNTDRMWYVIGAVIVGAALIFLMNGTLPTLFANIGETFEDKVGVTTEMTDGIMPQIKTPDPTYLGPDDVYLSNGGVTQLAYSAADHMWTLRINNVSSDAEWHVFHGLRMHTKRFVVPYGGTVRISYDIYIPENVVGASAVTDINNGPLDPTIPAWDGNDNDVGRLYNGTTGAIKALTGGEWTTITAQYSNTSSRNVEKTALYDRSHIGVQNKTGAPLTIKIRNARLEIVE